MSIIGR